MEFFSLLGRTELALLQSNNRVLANSSQPLVHLFNSHCSICRFHSLDKLCYKIAHFVGVMWTSCWQHCVLVPFKPVKEILLKLLIVMLLWLVGMHWQRQFILGCLIGMLMSMHVLGISFYHKYIFCMIINICSVLNFSYYFVRLVDKINMSVGQDPNSHIQIGVLDIYGFECFKHNR